MSKDRPPLHSNHLAIVWLLSLLGCCAGSVIALMVVAGLPHSGSEFLDGLPYASIAGLVGALPVGIVGSLVPRRDARLVVFAGSALVSVFIGWLASAVLSASAAA